MTRHRTLPAIALLMALLLPTSARATGYAIYEQGAAALGMAGAATASVDDASAVFFNPAAMTRLTGTNLYVGGSALAPVTSFAGRGPNPGYGVTEEMNKQVFFPPTVYVTRKLPLGFAAGAGLNTPYGLGVEWDPVTFSGRYITTKVTMETLNGSACLAWAPNDQLSFAAGGDALYAKVLLKNRTLMVAPGGGGGQVDIAETKLSSDYTPGYGWNAAVHYTPVPRLRVGAFYRSKVVVHVDDARAEFTQIPTGDAYVDAVVAAGLPPDQGVKTVLRFPAIATAGVAFDPVPDWTVEADFVWYEWSLFTDLPIYFDETTSRNTTRIEDYKDSWQVRVGAEKRRGDFAYRFGYYFDRSPAPVQAVSPLLPDADRIGISGGLGWKFGAKKNWNLDGYALALFLDRRYGYTSNGESDTYADYHYAGDYKTFTGMLGVGLGYHF
jgi:long-chain fatty acid transport protein